MHLAICMRKPFFSCCINSYNMSQLKCFFTIACKTLKMAFEVSREVLPDKAFLIASVQMAPQLKCWQPVWGDRPFLISSFYVLSAVQLDFEPIQQCILPSNKFWLPSFGYNFELHGRLAFYDDVDGGLSGGVVSAQVGRSPSSPFSFQPHFGIETLLISCLFFDGVESE